jgi:lipopolysaccharide export system permease protein
MSTIKRYVITETLKIFVVTAVVTLLLLTLGGGAKEGIRQGLPPQLVLKTMPFFVPEMLRFTIPGCLLFAVCSVFGRMSVANEIVAIKSLGVNPWTIVWPVLVLAYMLSIGTYVLYDVCAVWSRPNLRRLFVESVDEIAMGVLRSQGSFSAHGMSIVVKGVEGDLLLHPVITVEPRGESPAMTLVAKEARLQADGATGVLHLECYDGRLEIGGSNSLRFPDRFVQDIPLEEPKPDPDNYLSPAALGSRAIKQQIERERNLIADLEEQMARAGVKAKGLAALERRLRPRRARLFRLEAEVPRRLSNGFGCLCFALVGVPVAMRLRSADTMSVFFVCFLPILVVYYPLLVTGENLARGGFLPQLSVWLADAVVSVVAIALLVRAIRH